MKVIQAFIVHHFKRYGILTALLSVICLVAFFMAIIPASAVIATGEYSYTQKYVGGVQIGKSDMNTVYDATIPRNADGERLQYAGRYKVTHYCACTICTWGSGITASGKPVAEGMIAADWGVLPKGTVVYIQRGDTLIQKVVEDRGGAINGNIIDVYVPSHGQALQMGVYYTDLWVDPDTVLP